MHKDVRMIQRVGTCEKCFLVSLATDEVQTSVKFVNLLTPHPQPLSQWERVAEGRVRGESTTETQPSVYEVGRYCSLFNPR